MNPTVTAQPARPRPIVDVGRPALPNQHAAVPPTATHPASVTPAPAPDTSLTASIVSNIPMHAPAPAAAAVPVSEDAELDTIMQDIGHELKQAERKTPKKHRSLFGRKHQKPVKKPAVPLASAAAVPAVAAAPAQVTEPPASMAAKPAAKPVKTASAPIGVIFMTILVTGALIAAAIYSYK